MMTKGYRFPAALLLTCLLFAAAVLLHLLPGQSSQRSWKLRPGRVMPAVAVGFSHGVILAPDGSLWTWGETGLGWQVLGLGSNVRTQACLQRVGLETNWVDVAAGGSTTLALKSDGTIWAWGQNIYGQLGDGTTVREQAFPVPSLPGNDWKQVATAGPHSVALKRNGTLWAWGNNWAGQLGNGTTNHSRVPVQVGTCTNWTRIWANLIQNVGQQTDGSLWFWGWDYTRSEKGSSIPVPTRVSPDTNWVDVGMGDWMVFAIKSDGTLWAWGRQAHLYTGATNANADSAPVRVGSGSDWRACSSFSQSCPLFMKLDGSIWVMDASDRRDTRGFAVVTPIVAGLVTNNYLNFTANSSKLGGDPAFGVVKSLEITFQHGGTNRVATFKENSQVSLGGKGLPLIITRAVYGNPRVFRHVPAAVQRTDPIYAPAVLRRIQLPKNVVAFCGGRHQLGVALTSEREIWVWGEALGRHTPAIPPLQLCSRLLNKIRVPARWGDPQPVTFDEPTRLEVSPP